MYIDELNVILEKHRKWLMDEGGERADLSKANLSGVNASTGEVALWLWGPKEESSSFNATIHLSYACRYATVYGVS